MFTIVLDPGHVKDYNQGTIKEYREGSKMYYLAQYIKKELENYNVNVIITRNSITENPSLSERGKIAGINNASVFISLHTNGVTSISKDKIFGCEIYRSINRPDSEILANTLGNNISKLIANDVPSTYFRGTKTRKNLIGTDYYGVLRSSVEYSCVKYAYIIEHAFHSNIEECAWLNNDNNLKKLAKTEADILIDYFKIDKKDNDDKCSDIRVINNENNIKYIVSKNDTLWSIANRYLGNGNKYNDIIAINKENGIELGSTLKIGDRILLPLSVFKIKIVSNPVNIYKEPNNSSGISGSIKDYGVYTITELSSNFGKLLSGAGWVCLDSNVKRI